MNTEYARRQIKEAIDLIGNIDFMNRYKIRYNQKQLNEAYSILFDLYNLYKMEVEDD